MQNLHHQNTTPLDKALKRIWEEHGGEELFKKVQACTFPVNIDNFFKSEFIGKLNRACNHTNNPSDPSILLAASLANSAFKILSSLSAYDIEIDPIASFIIDPVDVYKDLLDLSKKLSDAKENPQQTPEYEKNLLEQLENTSLNSKDKKIACNELIDLSESKKINDQEVAARVIRSLIDSTTKLDKEVVHAVISSSKCFSLKLSDELLISGNTLQDYVKKMFPDDRSLRKAATNAAISIDLNTYARIISDHPDHFPENLKFLIDQRPKPDSPYYRNMVRALASVCRTYNEEDQKIASKILNNSFGRDSLKSELEYSIENKDPKCKQILNVLLSMPEKKLAVARIIKKAKIKYENDNESTKILEDALQKFPKWYKLFGAL